MAIQLQTGILYYGYIDAEMVEWWLHEGEHLAVRMLDDTRLFVAKENWTYQKKFIGADQVEFRMSYGLKLLFFKIRINSERSRVLDGRDFAMGKNGPQNFKERPFSSIFNGEKVLDPDGLIFGKDTNPYTDQIFGSLHSENDKPFVIFWRTLKKDAKVGCLLAQQQSSVFILQSLIMNPEPNGKCSIKLEGASGNTLEISPDVFEEVKDGVLRNSLLMVSELHKQIGRIRPPENLPLVALDPIQLANTRVRCQ